MGILYNRFTPGFTLLPYSDQSKIITYATYENFDANSSTWGEGTAPIQRSGTWYKDQDASGYISFHTSYNSISNTSALGNGFTIYEVLKHVDYPQIIVDKTYNLIINRGSQSTSEYLLSPFYNSSTYDYSCHTTAGDIDVSPHLSSLDQLHITVAAYEYSPANRQSRIWVSCNRSSGYGGPTTISSSTLQGIQLAGQRAGSTTITRCYKFIAVVAENEENIYIGNRSVVEYNMAVLNSYFGVNYPTPIH